MNTKHQAAQTMTSRNLTAHLPRQVTSINYTGSIRYIGDTWSLPKQDLGIAGKTEEEREDNKKGTWGKGGQVVGSWRTCLS